MKFKDKAEEKVYYEQKAGQEEFLDWYKHQDLPKYEKPSVTVDSVMFGYDEKEDKVKVLLIKRKANPFRECWAIPGGFVDMTEDTYASVKREVKEETDLEILDKDIEQLATYGKPNRDPRGRVISIAHLVFLETLDGVTAGDDAQEAEWFTVDRRAESWVLTGESGEVFKIELEDGKLNPRYSQNIAFDHVDILTDALNRIEGSLNWKPKVLNILGGSFTIPEARKVYAHFLPVTSYHELDNSNFKKKHGHLFEELGLEKENSNKVGRPSKLYKLK